MKKTNTKARMLSLVLSLLMIISIVPLTAVNAFAESHTQKVTITDGLPSSMEAAAGTRVNFSLDVTKVESGKAFDKWEVVKGGVTIAQPASENTYFIMGSEEVEIKATYRTVSTTDFTVTITGGQVKVNGVDTNKAKEKDTVTITAIVPSGYVFKSWNVKKGTVTVANTVSAEFKMPAENVEIEAVLEKSAAVTHKITVKDGVAVPANAAKGETVTIKAGTKDDKVFDRWIVRAGGIVLNNYYANETTFVMGDKDVEIEATFKNPTPMSITVVNYAYVKLTDPKTGKQVWTAKKGDTVNVELNNKYLPKGMTFTGWRVIDGNGKFTDETKESTSFVMGEGTAKIMPCFKFKVSVVLAYNYNNIYNNPYYNNGGYYFNPDNNYYYYNTKSIEIDSAMTVKAVSALAKKEFGVDYDLSLYFGGTLLDEKAMIGSYGLLSTSQLTASYKVEQPSGTDTLVYFDANGGTVDTVWAKTYRGYLINLPVPTRAGYRFEGWYTAKVGGTRVDTYTIFTTSTVLYAHWTYSYDYNVTYDIEKDFSGNAMGTVKYATNAATVGDKVSFTVSAYEGYEIDDVVVIDSYGDTIKLSESYTGTYYFTMPYSAVTVKITFKYNNPYSDVRRNDSYYDAVMWATENGIVTGTSSNKFTPNGLCTRGYMVTFLWRAAGCPTPKKSVNPFDDVSKNDYYYKAVLWAVEKGIVKGTSETEFSPDKTVNRAQAITFIWRFAGSHNATSSFSDVEVDSYYYKAVSWATKNDIAKGVGKNMFDPMGECTRADVVTFLYNYFVK